MDKDVNDPVAATVKDAAEQGAASQLQHILLIHGTGAGATEDIGSKWWQRDSAFWAALNKKMDGVAACSPTDSSLFHWGMGPNSERKRREAGRSLYKRLLDLDGKGEPYHVIGHSHGGSIVWHALVHSFRSGKPLRGLRSWTTIGTPFLRFEPDRSYLWSMLPFIGAGAAGLYSLKPALSVVKALPDLISQEFVWFVVLFGLSIVLLASIFLAATVRLGQLAFAAYDLKKFNAAAGQAWSHHGGTWNGLWSPEDEAIAGLSATLAMKGALVPRSRSWGDTTLTRIISAALTPARWVRNHVMAPCADEFVWARVTATLQGRDTVASQLCGVGRAPLAHVSVAPPSDVIASELRDLANLAAAQTLANVRSELGRQASLPDMAEFVVATKRTLSWNELIHNSYFSLDSVLSQIATHIATFARSTDGGSSRSAEPDVPGRKRRLALRVLPFLVSLALAGLSAAGAAMAGLAYKSSAAMFEERYQVEKVLTDKRTLLDASSVVSSSQNLAIEKWVGVLLSTGHIATAIDVAVEFPNGRQGLVTHLLGVHDDHHLTALLNKLAVSDAACAIAGAAADLLFDKKLAAASGAIDLLEMPRFSAGLGTCRLRNSAYAAAMSIRAAEAAPTTVITQWAERIDDADWRRRAYRDALTAYVERDAFDIALELHRSYPAYVDSDALLRAMQRGRANDDDLYALARLAASDSSNTWRDKLAVALANAGLRDKAITIHGLVGGGKQDIRAIEVALAGSTWNSDEDEAFEHLPRQDHDVVVRLRALNALRKGDIDRARRIINALHPPQSLGREDFLEREFARARAIPETVALTKMRDHPTPVLLNLWPDLTEPADKIKVAEEFEELIGKDPIWFQLQLVAPIVKDLGAVSEATPILDRLTQELIRNLRDSGNSLDGTWTAREAIKALVSAGRIDAALSTFASKAVQDGLRSDLGGPDIKREMIRPLVSGLVHANRVDEAIHWCQQVVTAERPEGCGFGWAYAIQVKSTDNEAVIRSLRKVSKFDAAIIYARTGQLDELGSLIREGNLGWWSSELQEEFVKAGMSHAAYAVAQSEHKPYESARQVVSVASKVAATKTVEERKVLEEALRKSATLPEQQRQSLTCDIAVELARRGATRQARLIAESCLSTDRLVIYASILASDAGVGVPELVQRFRPE